MKQFHPAIVLAGLLAADSVFACPFCAKLTRSASDDIRESNLVVFARLSDAQLEPPNGPSTELNVHTKIKAHSALESATSVPRIHNFVAGAATGEIKRLVFARVESGRIVASRIEAATPEYLDYLKSLANRINQTQAGRLADLFHYLDSADVQTSRDAYAEFAKSSYRSTFLAGKAYDPARIRGWLGSESTPPERVGLFGLLLGIAGEKADGDYLADLVDLAAPRHVPGLDGLLGGLCVLDRKRGLEKVVSLLLDAKTSPVRRMAAMSALTFVLMEIPPEDPKTLLERTIPALSQPDVASPLIDEMRRANCWKAANDVLALAKSERDCPAVLRYALACPEKSCREFVERVQVEQPAAILDARQAIEFEENTRAIGKGR